ncbi:hypothetical protein EWM64_g8512 [Hericium alpestre]|uniref:Tudor domain-containing protein n=1 Tax=Hericium alpestre TaxID=135208 RepID=A0A4Y9ZL52_9AGAM|nr:hypothetical protein EWM64_g8512 [Hericium alpestre]
MNDFFARLSAEKKALDHTKQRCAERDVQSRELLSAVGDFAERQRRAQDDVRVLLERRSESGRVLEEKMTRMFNEKREIDEQIGREIEEVFEESVRGAQEMESLLRSYDVAVPPPDDSENLSPVQTASLADEHARLASISSVSSPLSSFSGLSNPFTNSLASPTLQSFESVDKNFVNLTPLDTPKLPSSSISPSPPPDIPETKPEPREWDFFDYEEGVVWGREGIPQIKPPSSFTEYAQSEVGSPANPLPLEPVDDGVTILIPEWTLRTGNSIREIKARGVRVLKDGNVELSVKMIDSRTKLSALEELTQILTNYHRGTTHQLTEQEQRYVSSGRRLGSFVSVKSSYGSAWHRGQILRIVHGTNAAEILFIDSGFHEIVDLVNIRPLPTLFRFLPQQARMARLSFVKFHVHHAEALEALQNACTGRTLVAKLDHVHHFHYCNYSDVLLSVMHLRLMDPGVNSNDIPMSINGQLLREGLVTIDSELCRSSKAYHSALHELANAAMRARSEGMGMYRRQKAVEGDSVSQC